MTPQEMEKSKNIVDWIVTNDRIFAVFTVILLIAFFYVGNKLFNRIMKQLDDYHDELNIQKEESKNDRQEYFKTLSSQQDLIKKQQDLLEDEKKIFQDMSKDLTEINAKIDAAIYQKKKG